MNNPTHVPCGPYENREQARADAAEVYEQAAASQHRGVMAEANHAALLDVCRDAGVYLGAYDHRILRWLAGWEPETVQVVIGLIERANQSAGLVTS